MSLAEAKVASILKEHQPAENLQLALETLEDILTLPLFLLENQTYSRKVFTARRLLFMGESEPIPEEIELQHGLNQTNVFYVAIAGGALCLHPFLIWQVAERRYSFSLYLLHATESDKLKFISVLKDELETNGELLMQLHKARGGEAESFEEVVLTDGTDLLVKWQQEKQAREKAFHELSTPIPWDALDVATLKWYARHLETDDEDELKRSICERILDGRETLTSEEVRQIVLLFGREEGVREALRRGMIDCRARKQLAAEKRWDERLESSGNILQSLREAIEFFGRHVGVDGVTLDGLSATSGSADYVAMREGLVNLFIHQDYKDQSTVAQVEITKDRAIFYNAGKALVDTDSLIEGGKSQSRNPLISRALRTIGFAELAGSGLRELHRVWRESKRRPPKIESGAASNTFTLKLDWRPLPAVVDEFWKEKLGVKISPQQAAILSMLIDPGGFTLEEIASAQGLLVDDARIAIKGLDKEGLIEETNGSYQIKDYLRDLLKKSRSKRG